MGEYYEQRATAGLIVAEATQISPEGQGYFGTPSVYSPSQITGLEARDGRRTRQGRQDRITAVARWAHFTYVATARWQIAGIQHGAARKRQNLHRQGLIFHDGYAQAACD
jgi:hypothetical protein